MIYNKIMKTIIKYKSYILLFSLQVIGFLILQYFQKDLIGIVDFYYKFIYFLFVDSLSQLKSYYPNFYLLIFIITRTIKYLVPILVLYFIHKKTSQKRITNRNKPISLKLAIPFSISFIISLSVVLFFYSFSNYTIYQLALTRFFLIMQTGFVLLYFYLNFNTLTYKFNSYLNEPILPYSISITRVVFFIYLIYVYLSIFKTGYGNFNNLQKESLPFIGWLIDIIPITNRIYSFLCYFGAFSALMIALGYKTRLFLVINAITIFYVVATPNFFGKLWHNQIVIWISWILAFSHSFDIFSLDNSRKKTKIIKSNKYGFHLKVIWLHFGLIYLFAGFYKLWNAGFDWALSQSMINQIQLEWLENYNKIPTIRIDHFPVFLKISGLFVILFELVYIIFLFHKKLKWISIIGGLVMHNIIGYMMYISFLHVLQVFYLVFIPWNWLIEKYKASKTITFDKVQLVNTKNLYFQIPAFILLMNFIFGAFNINSYPFSIYPTYSAIVPDTFEFLEYKIKDKQFINLNLWEEAEKTHFRWESFSRVEPFIVQKFKQENIVDTSAINNLWTRWNNEVTVLNSIDSIEVYAIEIYLQPKLQKDTLYKEYLMTIVK